MSSAQDTTADLVTAMNTVKVSRKRPAAVPTDPSVKRAHLSARAAAAAAAAATRTADADAAAAAAASAATRTADADPASSGDLFVFGTGECAQLGLGEDRTERKFPSAVSLPLPGTLVVCGGIHNVVIDINGRVHTWGCNDEKALGRDGDEWIPGPVDALPDVVVVKATAGDSHTMVLDSEGRVWSWGAYRDGSGMIGFNPNTGDQPSAEPVRLWMPRPVVDIASGANHSLSLLDNGDIYEWGHIRIGQRIARHRRIDLLKPRLVNVRRFGKVVSIFAGHYQSWAITDQSKVFAFGLNQYGQAGVVAKSSSSASCDQLHKPVEVVSLRSKNIVKLAGGLHHALALTNTGQVYSFGRNNYGELGQGDLAERRTPTIVADLTDVTDIACGSTHSICVDRKGRAYSCGFGSQLQLGSGVDEDRTSFELVQGAGLVDREVLIAAAGSQHTVLIVSKPTTAPQ